MKKELKVIVNNQEGVCITSEGYKVIARGLVNSLGEAICKKVIKEFNERDSTNSKS